MQSFDFDIVYNSFMCNMRRNETIKKVDIEATNDVTLVVW